MFTTLANHLISQKKVLPAAVAVVLVLSLLSPCPVIGQSGTMAPPVLELTFTPDDFSKKDTLQVTVSITMDKGWHVNSTAPKMDVLIPSKLEFFGDGLGFGPVQFPEPKVKYLEMLDTEVEQFEHTFKVTGSVWRLSPQSDLNSLFAIFSFQACTDVMCLPPTRVGVDKGGKPLPEEELKSRQAALKAAASVSAAAPVSGNFFMELLLKILGAIVGGIILNLMPCVLPVLSLKIFSLIKQAGESRKRLIVLGLFFSAGVFACFWILSGVVIAVRSAGGAVGWGFQFQSSGFVIFMAVVMTIFSMNMFGVFEIILPSGANTKLNQAADQSGYTGAFFNGMLMVLLSTPCSAPFLGPAMGFAFSQSSLVLVILFSAVAFGMALPYMLLSFFPAALKWVPKPGNWMLRLKEFMGFLLLATVLWLLWVLGQQKGLDAVIWTSVFLLVLCYNCQLYNLLLPNGGLTSSGLRKIIVYLIILGVSLGAYQLFVKPNLSGGSTGGGVHLAEGHISYSEDKLAELVNSGQAVLIDFTASWCLTCKMNEKAVLQSDAVQERMKHYDVAFMVADWTNKDEAIGDKLKSFGRAGVPLYVIYLPGDLDNPIVLPELITKDMVVDALNQIEKSS